MRDATSRRLLDSWAGPHFLSGPVDAEEKVAVALQPSFGESRDGSAPALLRVASRIRVGMSSRRTP